MEKQRLKQHKERTSWRYFFPFQLLVLHIKKNHLLLVLWALLFGFATQFIAAKFGVPQQFLVPEYRGASGIVSFGIVGFALGGFITGFNLYTYIMHGYRFPFIATLSRPFHKFSLNNFVLPALFIITYAICSFRFQVNNELIAPAKAAINIFSLFVGITFFQLLSYFYFSLTNKDASAFGKGQKRFAQEKAPVESILHPKMRWSRWRNRTIKWHVETYMSRVHKLSRARDSQHYDKAILERVFSQNHINASRFEVALIISFLIIGFFRNYEYCVIPAAASALLFFTIIIMLLSVLHSWIKGWTLTIFIALFIGLNFFYTEFKWISVESRAIGLNYQTEPTPYHPHLIKTSQDTIKKDIAQTIQILENWKKKTGEARPKLVVIDCSGGGSRSAFWTMRSLLYADSICNNNLLDHTVMFTGASGGMFGAAYLRELMWLQQTEDINIQDTVYSERMAKDLLNPVILSIATNDWFIRLNKIQDGENTYTQDRATTFETQFHRNTNNILNKRLEDYSAAEFDATIPMMILSPTIVNDGRRLLISAQPMSYLTSKSTIHSLPEDIEYSRFFARHQPGRLQWVTALRMNATFPYIFPMTSMPTEPKMEIMDAGLRDNFGMKTTAQFLHTFRDWIEENTSGVIIVQARDLPKYMDLGNKESSLFGKFTAPLGTIYGNMTKSQDYNNDQMLEYLRSGYPTAIDLVSFELHQDPETQISLSWHLTQREKAHIRQATTNNYYLQQLEVLRSLLEK